MALRLDQTQQKRKQIQKNPTESASKASLSKKPRPWQKSAKPTAVESKEETLLHVEPQQQERQWNFAPLTLTSDQWVERFEFLSKYGQQRLEDTKKSIKRLVSQRTRS